MMLRAFLVAGLLAAFLSPATADDEGGLVDYQALKPELALDLAKATLDACREAGYQVAVVVVDRSGLEQALLRDRFAGPHTIETATRKAWTAVSFRTSTLELGELTGPGTVMAGIRQISKALPLGGGVPVLAAGSIVGGVGVSGAPGPDIDDECARSGIETIQDILDF
ncbi:MAG: heme-binding protein [Alphaproteobacteria bacterium]|nr:heme-binding protein [Alphaproteobacteria bacterium]